MAVFTMPPREGTPYRSVMGRGSISSACGLAAFLPLINGVANIKKWDDKFQQVLSLLLRPSNHNILNDRHQGRELEKLSERQSIYYAAYSSGTVLPHQPLTLSFQNLPHLLAPPSGVPMVIGRDFTFLETRDTFPDGSCVLPHRLSL